MDGSDKARYSGGEIWMVENQKRTDDLIINISEYEKHSKGGSPDVSRDQKFKSPANSPLKESNNSTQRSVPVSSPSHETVRFAPSPNRPPKIPTTENLTMRRALSRSVYSKPKSRFGEQSVPIDSKVSEGNGAEGIVISRTGSPNANIESNSASTREVCRTVPVTPKTPLISSFRGVDEDEEIYKRVSSRKKLKMADEFSCSVDRAKYLLKKKVLYFVYGLKKSVQTCLWFTKIVVWLLLTGIATTKVLVFLSSQLVLAVFMFGNTCKTIFEAIIFVFVMHPFDVGDRCVIDDGRGRDEYLNDRLSKA
ncbi:hypothetical protein ACS0TY_022000 [Phlomoides rotata]